MKFKKTIQKNIFLILYAIIPIYLYSMIIYPFLDKKFSWQGVQNVWERWQTLNAAVIALIASLIVIVAAKHQSNSDRLNNFRAAKSKLPHALSDICDYTRKCARYYHELYKIRSVDGNDKNYISSHETPNQPQGAIDVFVECIRFSDEEISSELLKIIESLQICHARLRGLKDETHIIRLPIDYLANIQQISEIRYRVDNFFGFARNSSEFSKPNITIGDLINTIEFQFDIRNQDALDRIVRISERKSQT